MQEFPLKRRFGLLLGIILIYIPLIVGGIWLSAYMLSKYLSLPTELTYSSFIVYGFSAALILTPVACISLWPIFYGRRVSAKIQKYLSKYVVAAFIVTLVSQIGFKMYYTSLLEENGYIACPGTPSAWTSGMVTKYVKDPRRCSQ
ncbi:DUF1240 domain-containing protein [Pantoea ananatis]|uniref:DUF1240 domain-containing protein n=1 Tax=Pantoea ananas TaxID=553 RepID=UPI001B3059BF|nr:DUF1240 domain-containing protein [Pantoea ananatis]